MKKFELICSVVCYFLFVVALVMMFVCMFAFEEKPDTMFYVTMVLAMASLLTNGTLFMAYYKDIV